MCAGVRSKPREAPAYPGDPAPQPGETHRLPHQVCVTLKAGLVG